MSIDIYHSPTVLCDRTRVNSVLLIHMQTIAARIGFSACSSRGQLQSSVVVLYIPHYIRMPVSDINSSKGSPSYTNSTISKLVVSYS